MNYETPEQAKEAVDAKLGMSGSLEEISRDRYQTLVYCSPTGVPIFEVEVRNRPEGWKFGCLSTCSGDFTRFLHG